METKINLIPDPQPTVIAATIPHNYGALSVQELEAFLK